MYSRLSWRECLLKTMQNVFTGINPHLNSLLQTPGSGEPPLLWVSFHSARVNPIADFLNQQLPANYTAYAEQSLQVFGMDWEGGILVHRPQPAVTIFQQRASHPTVTSASAHQPTGQAALGRIVTRIELLSPSNKPGGSDAVIYQTKRTEALQTGVPLIEVDYLHETRSPIPKLPAYPADSDAFPFSIAASDPRPSWQEGQGADSYCADPAGG